MRFTSSYQLTPLQDDQVDTKVGKDRLTPKGKGKGKEMVVVEEEKKKAVAIAVGDKVSFASRMHDWLLTVT